MRYERNRNREAQECIMQFSDGVCGAVVVIVVIVGACFVCCMFQSGVYDTIVSERDTV
jgi:hypothetical protein